MNGHPKIALDFVLQNARSAVDNGTINLYIQEFVNYSWITDVKRMADTDYSVKQLMNHKQLKKEISETIGSLCQVERALRGRCVDRTFGPLLSFEALKLNESKIKFYDVCSGKGLTSFFLAFLFPSVQIVMVDFNANIRLDHLRSDRLKNVSYEHLDIHSSAFEDFLLQDTKSTAINIVIGIHLCGTLSTRLASLYNKLASISILLLSPCCIPKKGKGGKELMEIIRRTHWDSYNYWCLTIFFAINGFESSKDMIHDPLILSEKSKVIWAARKQPLSQHGNDSVQFIEKDVSVLCNPCV